MKLVVYKAILHTGGKSKEKLLNKFGDQEIDEQTLGNYLDAYNLIDGLEVNVTNSFITNENDYSLLGWNNKDDYRVRDFIYLLEQDPVVGAGYIGNRELFNKDWELGNYESPGALHFDKEDVEIIEKMT